MLYVIPFVILLIVLVVLKKRQDAQGSEKSSVTTATQKNKAKKASSSAKVAPNKTQAVQNSVVEKKQTTTLDADNRNKIEKLIQERNFFSAEAQINQALKKDNSQHELYLYLLDIHILQKDEFAISQLLNHVRSLELEDILEQAEAKKTEYDASQNKFDEAINFTSPNIAPEPAAVPQIQNTADFDALMADTAAPAAEPKAAVLAFDQLQDDAPKAAAPAAQPAVEEIKPLEFNLSFDTTPKKAETAGPVQEAAPSIDFGSFSVQETAEAAPEAPVQDEIQPLDFSLKLTPEDSAAPEAPATPVQEDIQPLDFSFSLDTPQPAAAQPVSEPTLNFDLGSLDSAAPAVETPAATEKPAAPASTGVNFDISKVSSPAAAPADSSDPLVQSFPELAESNEIAVNLELAQQYIKLGAYDAARELLSEKEAEYSDDQRQQADLLLNQIAS